MVPSPRTRPARRYAKQASPEPMVQRFWDWCFAGNLQAARAASETPRSSASQLIKANQLRYQVESHVCADEDRNVLLRSSLRTVLVRAGGARYYVNVERYVHTCCTGVHTELSGSLVDYWPVANRPPQKPRQRQANPEVPKERRQSISD